MESGRELRILMVDNYDSFTYNLVQMLQVLGCRVTTVRNNQLDAAGVEQLNPDAVVISPGPGSPTEAGSSVAVIRAQIDRRPVLGVCLGMQCLNEAYGGQTTYAPRPVHGRADSVWHSQQGLFKNIPNPFPAARYHSLTVARIPSELRVDAWSNDGVVMAVSHRDYPLYGLQFHPESFLTAFGESLMLNFLEVVRSLD
jgi:anthranilate synthase component 2